MNNEIILSLKRNIEAIGRLLWKKDLVTGLNGNISPLADRAEREMVERVHARILEPATRDESVPTLPHRRAAVLDHEPP